MGNAFLDQSNAAEAVEYYRMALELRPEAVSIRYALGCMYLGLHRWDRCVAEFEQAIRLDPENAWCHNRLGFALAWRGGHDDEAIAQFREVDPPRPQHRLDAPLSGRQLSNARAASRRPPTNSGRPRGCSPRNAPSGSGTCG